MGMGTHVMGFRPPNDKFLKMKAIYDACKAGGVEVPDDVDEFFDYSEPADHGVVTNIDKATSEWNDGGSRAGIEVDLSKLPKGITVIRFYNSW